MQKPLNWWNRLLLWFMIPQQDKPVPKIRPTTTKGNLLVTTKGTEEGKRLREVLARVSDRNSKYKIPCLYLEDTELIKSLLVRERINNRLTQVELAELMNAETGWMVSDSYISMLESGVTLPTNTKAGSLDAAFKPFGFRLVLVKEEHLEKGTK